MKANEAGQSLVELAVVLPAFCFSVLAIVQLMVFCRNQLELQRMALAAADDVALSTPSGDTFYSKFNFLWGRLTPPRLHRSVPRSFTTWHPYRGLWTIPGQGHYMPLELSAYLLPGQGITPALGISAQKATSVALIEPQTPKDPA